MRELIMLTRATNMGRNIAETKHGLAHMHVSQSNVNDEYLSKGYCFFGTW